LYVGEPRTDVGRITAQLRAMSKRVLGTQFRAEVCFYVKYGTPPFWARRIHETLGIPENKVASELSRLVESGAVVQEGSEAWDRRKLYQPRASALLDFAHELVQAAAREEATRLDADPHAVLMTYWSSVFPDSAVPEQLVAER
jgi:hypothetical protein